MSHKRTTTVSRIQDAYPTTFGLLAIAILQASMPSIAVAQGLPTAGVVTQGQATISASSNAMNITQSTHGAVIGWGSFDIANGNSVNFQVPGGGATLNQIAGPASQINGSLTSNGTLFLVNPNGALFGQGASVNVGSLVTSTSTIDHNDFMNGQYTFTAGGNGAIKNSGTITAGSGGYVVLAGAGAIENNGTINVPGGAIQMVSADRFTLTLPTQNPFLDITLDGKATAGKSVMNSGTLTAGAVTLQAPMGTVRTMGSIKATSIDDLKGSVNISGASVAVVGNIDSDGDITLDSSGRTNVAEGSISAANNIEIKSRDSVTVGFATIKSENGNIDISSHKTLAVSNSTLGANNGDIKLAGKGGGSAAGVLQVGALTVQNSTLTASKGNIHIDGRVDTTGLSAAEFTSEKQGVVIGGSSLIGKDIDINGAGFFGVLLQPDNTLDANNISITGVADGKFTEFAHAGLVIMGDNALTAQNALNIHGTGGQTGVTLQAGTTYNVPNASVQGHTTVAMPTANNGIKFAGKFDSSVNSIEFVSNGVIVKPPASL